MKNFFIASFLVLVSTQAIADNYNCNHRVIKVSDSKYTVNLSPVDMLNLASGQPLKLGYKDLDASETSCVATAVYQTNPEKAGAKLINIQLHDRPLPKESFISELNFQWCFNQLYNNQLDNGRIKLSQTELDHFRNQFESICMAGSAS